MINRYTAEDEVVMQTESNAARHRRYYAPASAAFAAQNIFYSCQFLFASLAKLLVLFRLFDFAVGIARLQRKEQRVRLLVASRKLLACLVLLGCLVSLAAAAALATYFARLSTCSTPSSTVLL